MPAMTHGFDRRQFLCGAGAGSLVALSGCAMTPGPKRPFEISLAQWSLHRTLRSGQLDNLGFPQKAASFGIRGVEYVNQFWKDKATDQAYLRELRQRCADAGVQSLLIMCDGEGALGDADEGRRRQAVQNHQRWVDAAAVLGCHSIRVNAQSSGSFAEQQERAADGLRALCEHAAGPGIDVIVENHGGLSSHGGWLAGTLRRVDHPRVGALPDFGNFRISPTEQYDRYQGVAELMPFARAVSAKSHDFDERGEEIHTDYHRMLRIVHDAGYRGWVGIEYEGGRLDEDAGILATLRLLERVRAELA